MPRFRFTTRALLFATLLIAAVLSLYVGRLNSLARFSQLTQDLNEKFNESHYPLTDKERQLTETVRIPETNWIVMFGDMKPPRFWDENTRKCEIGTGVDSVSLTCEVYFNVTQSQYSIYGNPSVAIEYFPDDLAPNEQLAIWFRDFLLTEYKVNATMSEFTE